MDNAKLINYIKMTENNVNPLKVASGMQGAMLFSRMPRAAQNAIVARSGKSSPYMSFVVEPYSIFLAFEIQDIAAAMRMLPRGYTLLPASLFALGDERPCAIVGAINVHTSVFWGSRVEFYLVAKNEATGMLSWIIASYETNTSSYDPYRGFIAPTTSHCVVTTSCNGELIVDVKSARTSNHISYVADLSHAQLAAMSERLWIEGNLSVDYGGDLQKSTEPFGLIFDPCEVAQGCRIRPEDVKISCNTFGEGILDPTPFEAVYFPYAQHFVTTSFPEATSLKNAQDLENEVSKLSRL